MKGTEKQVKWAEDIRSAALEQIRAYYAKSNPGRLEELDRRMAQLSDVLPQDAAWWIDNRHNFTSCQATMQTVAAVMPRK